MSDSTQTLGASWTTEVEKQGHFWVNVENVETPFGTAAKGQMYVQYHIPKAVLHPYPIVMIHGGGGQGTDFLGTPDGRPGWASDFLNQGYAVYVVDRPGYGRSPLATNVLGEMSPSPAYELNESMLTAPDPESAFWPTANLHTRWPGSGKKGDAMMDQFMASQGPLVVDMILSEQLAQRAGVALLDQIGPAILLTHSAGAPTGWLVADQRPDLVKGIVAVEPLGPPFSDLPGGLGSLTWGITATPLTYDPPCNDAEALKQSPHGVPSLQSIPIGVFTSEASAWVLFDPATVQVLAGFGAKVQHVKLADLGIHGNGHMMMQETNSDEIAAAIGQWLSNNVEGV